MESLPIYKAVLTNGGVEFIAFVDRPAIEENFLAFSKVVELIFKATDPQQQIVTGPILIPDQLIMRKDPKIMQGQAHYVYFDADTIKETVFRFFQQGNTSNVNIMHNNNMQPNDIFMFESFITDSKRGINPPTGFENAPDGTWFGSYKINNNDVWTRFIATGELRGFSIQGFFGYEKTNMDAEIEMIEQIIDILEIEG